MLLAKPDIQKKIKTDPYLFTNLVFAFFPISFVIGSLIVNTNLLLFCCLGIYHLKSRLINFKYNFFIKIILLFFLLVIFSTILSYLKSIYFDLNDPSVLDRLLKSIFFFRFFLFLIIVYFLNSFNILNFKYFFVSATFSAIVLSLDIIYQYIFGFDIVGYKTNHFRNSGFFGDEEVAGGYLSRFSFFAIFYTIFFFKENSYKRIILTTVVICILGVGILFAGNRMPLILFLFGLFMSFLLHLKIKKVILVALLALIAVFTLIILSDNSYKNYIYSAYNSSYHSVKSLIPFIKHKEKKWTKQKIVEENGKKINKTFYYSVKFESQLRRVILSAVETWKENKIFGNGIKSYRRDCWKLNDRKDIYLGEDIYPGDKDVFTGGVVYPGRKNRLCSTHPHNYYFEILTDMGVVGLFSVLLIGIAFMTFVVKNFKLLNQITMGKSFLAATFISLILETLPLRSTGSIFTTNNATYLILIASIALCYKKLLEVKNPHEKNK